MVSSGLTDSQMAEAIVASQTFANVNNGGTLVNPDAPSSPAVVDSFFQQTLGHLPSAATLAGFSGLTNEQAFYAFATSATVTNVIGSAVTNFIDSHYVG
jgi:membrane protein YqaA with SNARE-associated domain